MAIVISGVNNNDKITASDGTIDLLSGVNYGSEVTVPSFKVGSNIQIGNAGIITATTFTGNVTGNINNDILLLQTGSYERVRIDSSGRVLIGTTTEGHENADDLTIATSGTGGITIRTGTSNSGSIYFSDATSGTAEYAGFVGYSHANNSMIFGTNGAEKLRIMSNGYFGLGINSPSRRIHVHTSGSGGDYMQFTNDTTGTTDGDGYVFGINGNEDVIHNNLEATNTIFFTSGAERLRINSSGSVSIGNNPTVHSDTIFHVEKSSGETNVKFEGNDTMGARLSLHNNSTSGSANNQIAFCDAGGQSTSTIIGYNTDQTNNYGELVFSTRSAQGSPPAERLRIHSGGEVTKLHNPRFQVYMSGTHFQISSGSGTITYNTEVYDTGSNYDTSTGRFTAPVSGAYYFHHCLQIREALSGTGVIEAKVWVIPNGSSGSGSERIRDYTRVDDTNAASHAFGLLGLNAGDQVYPAYYNGISGNAFAQNNGGNTPLTTFFEGYLIQ